MSRERLRTLFLSQNGTGRPVLWTDTVLRGIFGLKDGTPCPPRLARYERIRVMFALLQDFHRHLSYMPDWRDAFLRTPNLEIEECNINNLLHFSRCLMTIRRYDLIVVSHGAAGDDLEVLTPSAPWLARRRGKLAVFIGNEYDLLDDKIAFIKRSRADVVCSQLPIEAARYLYGDCSPARVISLPHALNPDVYRPDPNIAQDIDVGFIGDIYWPFIGDNERTLLIRRFQECGADMGLRCDIRTSRVQRDEWSAFLCGCKSIIGAESGTYYLNDHGRLLTRARDYNLMQNRQASFEEVFEMFFKDQPRAVSGKSISSRHFEPIGTKTCQLLLEGDYNGILKSDEHYISVSKDLSNLDEAIGKFKDRSYRARIADNAYEYVMDCHTYSHRVKTLLQELGI